ncbi:hypothetical protein BASA81_017549 [Batrachochytrium salamandrivorans]|nr:hypothetical protein BASA81_017549 [Batrachochytrium salamandrivorans]
MGNQSLIKQGRGLARSMYQSSVHGDGEDDGRDEEEDEEQVDLVLDLWTKVEQICLDISKQSQATASDSQLDQVFGLVSQAIEVLLTTPSSQPVNRSALALVQFAFKQAKLQLVHSQMVDFLLAVVQEEGKKKRLKLKALEALKLAFITREAMHPTLLYSDTLSRLIRALASVKQYEDGIKLQILDMVNLAVLYDAVDPSKVGNLPILLELVFPNNSTCSIELKLHILDVLDDFVRQNAFPSFSAQIVTSLCEQFPATKSVDLRRLEMDLLRDCLRHSNVDVKVQQQIVLVLYNTLELSSTTELKLKSLECFDTLLRMPQCASHHDRIVRTAYEMLDRTSSDTQHLELQCECLDLLRAILGSNKLVQYRADAENKYMFILQSKSLALLLLKTRVYNNLLLLFKKKNLCQGFTSDQLPLALCDVLASTKERAEQKRSAICVLIAVFKAHCSQFPPIVAKSVCNLLLYSPNAEDLTLMPICIELLCLLHERELESAYWLEPNSLLVECLLQRRIEVKDLGEVLAGVDKLTRLGGPRKFVHSLVEALASSPMNSKQVVQTINMLLFTSPQYFTPDLFQLPGFTRVFVCHMDLFILKGEVKDRLWGNAQVPEFVSQFLAWEQCIVSEMDGDTTKVIAKRKQFVQHCKAVWALTSAAAAAAAGNNHSALRRLPTPLAKLVFKMLI